MTTPNVTPVIEVGDLVERIDRDLDPRPVAWVGDGNAAGLLRLQIGSLVTDPIPADLYRVYAKAGAR